MTTEIMYTRFSPIKRHKIKRIQNKFEIGTFSSLLEAQICITHWNSLEKSSNNISYLILTEESPIWDVYVGMTKESDRLNSRHPQVKKDKKQIFIVLRSLYRGQDLRLGMEAMLTSIMRASNLIPLNKQHFKKVSG